MSSKQIVEPTEEINILLRRTAVPKCDITPAVKGLIDQFGIPSSREVSFCQNRAHRSFWTPDLGEISAISSSLFIVWTQFTRDRNDR